MFTRACANKSQAVRTAVFFLEVSLLFAVSHFISAVAANRDIVAAQQRRQTRRTVKQATPKTPSVDYSQFSHRNLKHVQSCDACHKFPSPNWKDVRKGDDAFPDVTEYPQHAACMSCHNQQFFRGVRPVICSVCHVSATPRNSLRYPYPSLGEAFFASEKGRGFVSDFNINFPHDKHVDIVARLDQDNETNSRVRFISASFRQDSAPKADASCGICHQTYQAQGDLAEEYVTAPPKDLAEGAFWLKKGAFKTVPLTHAMCFTCHSQDSGLTPAPSDCNVCHKLPTTEQLAQRHSDFDPNVAAAMGITDNVTLLRWRNREAGAFRHEWFSHAELSCTNCHKVTTINTLDEKSKKVPIMTCGGPGEGCHITKTTDEGGILNYVVEQRKTNPDFQCKKCHMIFGKQPVPQSHLDAITATKTK